MDRALAWLRVAAFLLLIAAPLLALRPGPASLENEKRAGAAFPWPFEGDEPSLERLGAFFSDHFGFRGQLVRWHHWIAFDLLRQTTIGQVIRGEDGRLFYVGRGDGIDVRDFSGNWPHDPGTVERLAAWQADFARSFAARGIRYLLVLAPNKQTVYPESLPAMFGRHAPGMLDELIPKLAAHSEIAFLDLRAALLPHRSEDLYYRSDTHWNARGAFYAAQAIVAHLRPWFPGLHPLDLGDYRIATAMRDGGDLAVMLGLQHRYTEPMPLIERRGGALVRELASGGGAGTWEGAPGGPRLLYVGDSFGVALAPRLADAFSRVRYVDPWRVGSPGKSQFEIIENLVAEERPDVVVYELLERYLQHLAP